MIPSVLSSQVQKGAEDFLKTTFPVSTTFFHGVMDRFQGDDRGIFKGPYISIKLPYRTSSIGPDFFTGIPLRFPPYLHQEMAFRRLSGEQPASAIIARYRLGKDGVFSLPDPGLLLTTPRGTGHQGHYHLPHERPGHGPGQAHGPAHS
jgi:hypothetical protein